MGTTALMPPLEPESDDPRPEPSPCPKCGHAMAPHRGEGDECYECYSWGGPCE